MSAYPASSDPQRDVSESAERAEEEEGGRLFGDGLSTRERELLEYIDTVEDISEGMTEQEARRITLVLERAVAKNRELRERHPEEPSFFMASEADLDEALKRLRPISSAPELYGKLISWRTIPLVLGLLNHPNADIAIDAVEVLSEWLDEDIAGGSDVEGALSAMAEALMAEQAPELLMSNLRRLNEEEPTDRDGVFQTLSIFENLISIRPDLATPLGEGKIGLLLPWLMNRVRVPVSDSNRTYASELLAILLQQSEENRGRIGRAMEGVEGLLRSLALYKRHDPVGSEAIEHMENIVDALCSVLGDTAARKSFYEAEGVELLTLLLQEKKMGRIQAYKILSFVLSGQDEISRLTLEQFINLFGLRLFSSAWMQKDVKRLRKGYKDFSETAEEEHLAFLLVAMLRQLPSPAIPEEGSNHRARLLAQFARNDYALLDRLLEMRETWRDRVTAADLRLARNQDMASDIQLDREERYLNLLESGLFTLQMLDIALVYLCQELPGSQDHARMLLHRRGQSFVDVAEELEEYSANIGEEGDGKGDVRTNHQEAEQLMGYLANFIAPIVE